MQERSSPRHRINVSRTTTGKVSWESTVEIIGGKIEDVLAESDRLVAELRKRYPMDEVENK